MLPGKLDTEMRQMIGPWSPRLMFLKGKLCSLRVAVSAYVSVSLLVDPSQVSLEWLLVCFGQKKKLI